MVRVDSLPQYPSIKGRFLFTHKTLAIKRLCKRFSFVRYSVRKPFARYVILPHEMILIIVWNDADCSIKSIILAKWTHQMVLCTASFSIMQSIVTRHKHITLWDYNDWDWKIKGYKRDRKTWEKHAANIRTALYFLFSAFATCGKQTIVSSETTPAPNTFFYPFWNKLRCRKQQIGLLSMTLSYLLAHKYNSQRYPYSRLPNAKYLLVWLPSQQHKLPLAYIVISKG